MCFTLPMNKNLALKYLFLLFGILCISWSAIFVKMAGISGLGSAFYRLFIGTLGIIPIWFMGKRSKINFQSFKIAVICGVIFACDLALWNTSILLTKAAVSTLLANLAPIWVGLGSLLFFKEKPHTVFWTGALVALAGVAIIMGFKNIIHINNATGAYLAISASIFYGAYLLTVRHGRSTLDTITFTGISMATSSVILFILCLAFHTKLTGFSVKTWASLSGLGLISQLSGWLAINYALRYIKPTIASVSLLSQSVFTALLSVPVLHEILSTTEILGTFLVLSGIYLVNRENFKERVQIAKLISVRIFKKSMN